MAGTTTLMNPSKTYKLTPPNDVSRHAIYFTVVDAPIPIRLRTPSAFFVNCKEMDSFQWVTGLMTSWSRQLKAGVPIKEIIDDMKETFDPKGSYFLSDGSGRRVNSIVHHMGLLLEGHCDDGIK